MQKKRANKLCGKQWNFFSVNTKKGIPQALERDHHKNTNIPAKGPSD